MVLVEALCAHKLLANAVRTNRVDHLQGAKRIGTTGTIARLFVRCFDQCMTIGQLLFDVGIFVLVLSVALDVVKHFAAINFDDVDLWLAGCCFDFLLQIVAHYVDETRFENGCGREEKIGCDKVARRTIPRS
jgi:hypothetical protein